MTEQTMHRVMAMAAGMTAEVFHGRIEDCVAVATNLIGKPVRDKDGEQIGTVEHTWTEPTARASAMSGGKLQDNRGMTAVCLHCGEPILPDDPAIRCAAYADGATTVRRVHYDCHVRRVIGGLNHLRGRCICCGGTEPPDPPDLTRREAARQAVAYWNSQPPWRECLGIQNADAQPEA